MHLCTDYPLNIHLQYANKNLFKLIIKIRAVGISLLKLCATKEVPVSRPKHI